MSVQVMEGAAGGTAAGMGLGGGEPRDNGAILFAIAVLLLGFAFIGLWIAFHKPENAEGGGFPGLLGQMIQWIEGSAAAPGAGAGGPAGGTGGGSPTKAIKSCAEAGCKGGLLGLGTGNSWLVNTISGSITHEANWLKRQAMVASGLYVACPSQAVAESCRKAARG